MPTPTCQLPKVSLRFLWYASTRFVPRQHSISSTPGDIHSPHHTPLPICYFHCAVAAAPTDPLLLLLFDVCVLCAAAAAAAGVCVASAVATQRYYHVYCYRR